MREYIYTTSEKIELVNEYLQKNTLLSHVDELEIIIFCEYLNIDLTLENLNKIQVISDSFIFEDKNLKFISEESDELNEIVSSYYDKVASEELYNLPNYVVDALNLSQFYENVIHEYNDFEENGTLMCIYLYIDDVFENIYYVD